MPSFAGALLRETLLAAATFQRETSLDLVVSGTSRAAGQVPSQQKPCVRCGVSSSGSISRTTHCSLLVPSRGAALRGRGVARRDAIDSISQTICIASCIAAGDHRAGVGRRRGRLHRGYLSLGTAMTPLVDAALASRGGLAPGVTPHPAEPRMVWPLPAAAWLYRTPPGRDEH